ncbi:MAG: hypothetical protein KIT34_18890 [Cyanobacteria bacterium TGS_CYA1]|nr:hypothetical protein [Cyanobacteria bacterium TGS_CYA1]
MSIKKIVPTEKDWGNYLENLDIKWAFEKFGNRTLFDSLKYCKENPVSAFECFIHMPPIPFQYYIFAYPLILTSNDYLKGKLSGNMASDIASCFINIVILKLKESPTEILPVMENLFPALKIVALNQELYEADVSIYGEFSKQLNEIEKLYSFAKKSI